MNVRLVAEQARHFTDFDRFVAGCAVVASMFLLLVVLPIVLVGYARRRARESSRRLDALAAHYDVRRAHDPATGEDESDASLRARLHARLQGVTGAMHVPEYAVRGNERDVMRWKPAGVDSAQFLAEVRRRREERR